jgi:hypothetical protein
VVRAAYQAREPVTWPRRHARPLLVAAALAAVAAAAVSPGGRALVHSFRQTVGLRDAENALFSLPASGRLLVTGPAGTWVIHPDGSRRRVGAFRDAAWSPHGLFIAGTRGNELVALEPDGKVHWSLARHAPRLPSWTGTRTDTRIAYLSGGYVRVVGGDGKGDRALARAATVGPAWRPGPGRVLAYSTRRSVVVMDVDRGAVLQRIASDTLPSKLVWSDDGRRLLVFRRVGLRVYDRRGRVMLQDDPSDATRDADAAFVPGTHRLMVIRVHGLQSDVFTGRNGRLVFRGTGIFRQLAFSPDARWLLVSWPTANQWVFVRNGRPRRIVGASGISAQFGDFPRLAGWCCAP